MVEQQKQQQPPRTAARSSIIGGTTNRYLAASVVIQQQLFGNGSTNSLDFNDSDTDDDNNDDDYNNDLGNSRYESSKMIEEEENDDDDENEEEAEEVEGIVSLKSGEYKKDGSNKKIVDVEKSEKPKYTSVVTEALHERLEEVLVYEIKQNGTTQYQTFSVRRLYKYVLRAITNLTEECSSMNMQQLNASRNSGLNFRRASIHRTKDTKDAKGANANSDITYRERLGAYLHPRDMRKLVTPFSASNEPELIVRRHAMLLNFDPLRAIILRDRVLVLVPNGADSLLIELATRIRQGKSSTETSMSKDKKQQQQLKQLDHDGKLLTSVGSSGKSSNRSLLEASRSRSDMVKNAVSRLLPRSLSKDKATGSIPSKTGSSRSGLSSRGVSTLSERSMIWNHPSTLSIGKNDIIVNVDSTVINSDDGDDDDNENGGCADNEIDASKIYDGDKSMDFVLLSKNTCSDNNGNNVENDGDNVDDINNGDNYNFDVNDDDDDDDLVVVEHEWNELKGNAWQCIPFELQCVDAVLHSVACILSNDVYHLQEGTNQIIEHLLTENADLGDHAQEVLRTMKNSIREMMSRVKGFVRALNVVLEDYEDMALMNLSRLLSHPERFIQPVSQAVLDEESDEPELILEAQLQRGTTLSNVLSLIQGQLETTEEFVVQKSDTIRNRLLYINMLISLSSLCVGVSSLIGSYFGMNVENGIEGRPNAFSRLVAGTSVGSIILLFLSMLIIRRFGALPHIC